MSAESTTSTFTGAINTSFIVKTMLNYAIDPVAMLMRIRMEPVAGRGSKTAAFHIPTKDTALSGTITEATGLSNVAMDFANTTVAVAEVGILRQVTKMARRFNVLGEMGTYQFLIEDGGKMCLEKAETDSWAQLANASTSTGTSGAAFTIANFVDGISQLAINKAVGPVVAFLTATQMKNLRAALVASTAVVFSNGGQNRVLEKTAEDGYSGDLFGIPIYSNNLATTANGSTDKVGGIMVDGEARPENASTGLALGWMPEPESVVTPELPGYKLAITMAYGLGEIADFNYTKFVTVA